MSVSVTLWCDGCGEALQDNLPAGDVIPTGADWHPEWTSTPDGDDYCGACSADRLAEAGEADR